MHRSKLRVRWMVLSTACLLAACAAGSDGAPCPTCVSCPTQVGLGAARPAPTTLSESTPTILDAAAQFFVEDDWPFVQLEGEAVLGTAFAGQNGTFDCFAQAIEEQDRLIFYCVLPENVSEERRPAMADFITRANYGLLIGNFELDFSDGEVRYKTSIDVEGDRLTSALIKQVVYANVWTMDLYLPGIVAVAEGLMTPLQALSLIGQ